MGQIFSLTLLLLNLAVLSPARGQHPYAASNPDDPGVDTLQWHDNRNPAGFFEGGVLSVELELREGQWHPEGPGGPSLPMLAFAEAGGRAQVPGPLLRVRAGAELRIRLRNTLSKPALVWGLQDRPHTHADSVDLAPGEVQEVRFKATTPGTYYYWGRTIPNRRGNRQGFGNGEDALLSGALIVDPAAGPLSEDRVMVINMWANHADSIEGLIPREVVVANGRYWPHTERLSYAVGDSARWRIINAARTAHAMHLHGFHFRVDSRGTAAYDSVYTPERQPLAVTEFMIPGATLALTWVPKRVGNWLFHCHMTEHMTGKTRLSRTLASADGHHSHSSHTGGTADGAHGNHAYEGMGGLVVGIYVRPGPGAESDERVTPVRKLRLYAQARPGHYGKEPGYGYVLQEGPAAPASDSGRIPGPPILLTRGEPVEITVVNRLPEPTTVHWHGLEIDSYYDGIGDWSGQEGRLAPVIAPGDSFTVRITPVRTGTFIYHSHVEEDRQLALGLYGALLVLEPGQAYDPRTDLLFVIGQGGPEILAPTLLNGSANPSPITLERGKTYRLRFVSIPTNIERRVTIRAGDDLVQWQPYAKDGADLPAALRKPVPAEQVMSAGETYDFLLTPRTTVPLNLQLDDLIFGRPPVELALFVQ